MADKKPESSPAERPPEITSIKDALKKLKTSIEESRKEDQGTSKEKTAEIAEAKVKLFEAYTTAIDRNTGHLPPEKMRALLAVITPDDVLFFLGVLSSEGNLTEKKLRQDLETLKTELGNTAPAEGKKSQAEALYERVTGFVNGIDGVEGKGSAIVEKLKGLGITTEMIISGILSMVVAILESVSIIPAATKLACDLRFMQLKKDLENEMKDNPKDPIKVKQLADLNTPAAKNRFEKAYKLWMKGGKNRDTSNAPGLEAALEDPKSVVAEAKTKEADAERTKVEVRGTQEFSIHNKTDQQKIKITPTKENVSLVIGDRKATIEKIKEQKILRVEVLEPTDKESTVIIFVLIDGTTRVDVAATSISDLSGNDGKRSIKSRKGDASIECSFTKIA